MKELVHKYSKDNKLSLGIELGSTRIKAILVGPKGEVISSGNFEWENKLVDSVWTYELPEVWKGIQIAYKNLKDQFEEAYDEKLTRISSLGFSAMMHGYLAFDKEDNLLVPFRTWRNASTAEAQEQLTKLFEFNIPQRWSIAHVYQAILDQEEHVEKLDFLTTLAGYVHYTLSGEKVLGIGDASGMFPINDKTGDYNTDMIELFNNNQNVKPHNLSLKDLLPKVLHAGEVAGRLSKAGALLIDPEGDLQHGSVMAPPEGDAGTGMVATNAIKVDTGNISAGTSVFAMVVLKEKLSQVYPEIDIVTTPTGNSVAMVHVNNCTSELNAWISIFEEFTTLFNLDISRNEIFTKLLLNALNSKTDISSVLSYGYHSGENITQLTEGRPLLVRKPDAEFSLSSLVLSILNGAFSTLGLGLEILFEEGISIQSIVGHGGIFQTEGVAEKVVANIVKSPVTLMETANEGGAWGMAVLASYMNYKDDMTLGAYLDELIFIDSKKRTYVPLEEDIKVYEQYLKVYKENIVIEKVAVESMR